MAWIAVEGKHKPAVHDSSDVAGSRVEKRVFGDNRQILEHDPRRLTSCLSQLQRKERISPFSFGQRWIDRPGKRFKRETSAAGGIAADRIGLLLPRTRAENVDGVPVADVAFDNQPYA